MLSSGRPKHWDLLVPGFAYGVCACTGVSMGMIPRGVRATLKSRFAAIH